MPTGDQTPPNQVKGHREESKKVQKIEKNKVNSLNKNKRNP